MAEEFEHGPDPNDVRRHAKKMYSEKEYRQRYRRIDFYEPNDKQKQFHNSKATEVMLRAGNQLGKTHAAGAQMTFDALGFYGDWYEGRKFLKPPAIERPVDFLGWCACTTSEKIRDGLQLKLFGPVRDQGGLGSGLVPLDAITRVTMARGISDLVDTVSLNREIGGKALVRMKTYGQGREVFQGEPVDLVLLDEDISRTDASIYGECLARRVTTQGRIISSLTPLLGLSPLRKRFKFRQGADMQEILMTIHDCARSKGGHIPDAEIPSIIANYPQNERDCRAFGADMAGEGSVFETPVEQIKFTRDPTTFPASWKWLWGVDFRHSGSETKGHPFAAVLGCRDPVNDVIYIVHAVRLLGLAPMHVAAIKQNPWWQAPVAYPHDGGVGAGLTSGETIAQTYKKLGLHMREKHATFEGGGFNFDAGIQTMQNRFACGQLKIAAHLAEVFDEYVGLHLENGLVKKIDDDLLSAIRVLCMDIRHAQTQDRFQGWEARRHSRTKIAAGSNFDLFNPYKDVPGDDWDLHQT
jgi:phage terminase large subunit-like protein